MIIGIGTDIESINRFKKFKEQNNSFLIKVFTKSELQYCFSYKNFAQHLAGKFCAKEAAIKAMKNTLCLNQIEILNDRNGAPIINVKNASSNNLKYLVSISHTKYYATATVIVVEERID